MSNNKKYYWLKLKENFFRQKEIKKLRKIAGGDTFTIIYLKLQLLSLKNNGKLYYEGVEDNFIEEIALELDEDINNVELTVAYLQKHGLIVEDNNEDEYLLPETIECIGKETASTIRSRKHREKQKALQCNTSATLMQQGATKCNTEKEIEKEIDIEIRDRSSSSGAVEDEEESSVNEIMNLCNYLNFKLRKKDIKSFIEVFDKEVVKKAISIAVNTEAFRNKQIKNYSSYLGTVLKDLNRDKKVDVNINHEKKDLKFSNYTQRTYENDLYDDFIGWDE